MKKIIVAGAVVLVLAAIGCQKKGSMEDQLQTKPDTTAAEQVYEPTSRVDSAALREEQFRRDTESAIRPIYFAYNLYDLSEEARSTLAEIGRIMMKYGDIRLTIDGHCDERGSAEYNMALGQKRADQAKEYLVSYGVSSSRITTNSWGEERPSLEGQDESSWAKNRRDEFSIQR